MTKYKKLKPFQGKPFRGCSCCPPIKKIANLDMIIAVGFGIAQVKKNGKVIYSEPLDWEIEKGVKTEKDFKTLREIEIEAQKDPNNDYRLILEAPLRSSYYQRQGKNKWVLYKSGMGFFNREKKQREEIVEMVKEIGNTTWWRFDEEEMKKGFNKAIQDQLPK